MSTPYPTQSPASVDNMLSSILTMFLCFIITFFLMGFCWCMLHSRNVAMVHKLREKILNDELAKIKEEHTMRRNRRP
jgi:hypothetical protein